MTTKELMEAQESNFADVAKTISKTAFITGYTHAADKALDVYAKELKEIVGILNKVGEMRGIEGLGDILSIEGCLINFRKALEG